jgi:hypothetical protein
MLTHPVNTVLLVRTRENVIVRFFGFNSSMKMTSDGRWEGKSYSFRMANANETKMSERERKARSEMD